MLVGLWIVDVPLGLRVESDIAPKTIRGVPDVAVHRRDVPRERVARIILRFTALDGLEEVVELVGGVRKFLVDLDRVPVIVEEPMPAHIIPLLAKKGVAGGLETRFFVGPEVANLHEEGFPVGIMEGGNLGVGRFT